MTAGAGQRKLDVTLRALQQQAQAEPALIDCLVQTRRSGRDKVEQLIEESGGSIRHRIEVVPALAATLPVTALGIVAASKYVVHVEAEVEYHVSR